jgi:hypothetical protein
MMVLPSRFTEINGQYSRVRIHRNADELPGKDIYIVHTSIVIHGLRKLDQRPKSMHVLCVEI